MENNDFKYKVFFVNYFIIIKLVYIILLLYLFFIKNIINKLNIKILDICYRYMNLEIVK